jgi:hypothetical protein
MAVSGRPVQIVGCTQWPFFSSAGMVGHAAAGHDGGALVLGLGVVGQHLLLVFWLTSGPMLGGRIVGRPNFIASALP